MEEESRRIRKKDIKGEKRRFVISSFSVSPFVLLSDDAVYLEGEDLLREFVLNESGKVWKGSSRRPEGKRWIFGQYDDVVLPAIMYLLELSKLKHADRGNPVQMARAISAIVSFKVELIFFKKNGLCYTVCGLYILGDEIINKHNYI